MERGECGISEIISTVLVIILVIALTAVIGAVVLGWAVPVQKTAYIVTQATPVTITKASVVQLFMSQGESVSLAPATTSGLPIKFLLTNGSATYNFIPLPGVASQGWKPGTPLILFRNASGSWITDSTASVKNNTGFSNGTWTVTIIDANSNALIAQHNVDLIVDGKTPAPVSPPVANFTGSPRSGLVPLIIQFSDTSTGGTPTAWSWNFGDGDTTNSTIKNPIHRYMNNGTYPVSLTVTNIDGSNTKTQNGYITVTSLPGFTVEAWIKWNIDPYPVDNLNKWATIVVDGTSDRNRRYQLEHDQNNTRFEFAIATATKGTQVWSSTTPVANIWYYLVGVYNQTDPTNYRLKIYVNGSFEKSVTSEAGGLNASPNQYHVGGPTGIPWPSSMLRKFNGNIRGLKTYERAMSPAEITYKFATGLPPS